MTKITSLNNEYIKYLVKLKQKKYRDEYNEYLIEGEHLVEECRNSGNLIKTLGLKDCDIEINESVAKKLSDTKSGSYVFGVAKRNISELSYSFRTLICDNIQDPGNLGTLIRSAVSFGFNQVILSDDCVDEYNGKTIRSSQGAIFHIPIIRGDLSILIPKLQNKKIKVYATHLHTDSINVSDLNKKEPCAIILGNEGSGVKDDYLKLCDGNVVIPMHHFESLNVGVAGGIICYVLQPKQEII